MPVPRQNRKQLRGAHSLFRPFILFSPWIIKDKHFPSLEVRPPHLDPQHANALDFDGSNRIDLLCDLIRYVVHEENQLRCQSDALCSFPAEPIKQLIIVPLSAPLTEYGFTRLHLGALVVRAAAFSEPIPQWVTYL